jgi:16S rRNA (cytidine1402-2'-O)-methyltransferase
MSGTLYVCATPIGNLDDVTLRLVNTLREVAVVCAEDTRHTQKLLARLEIPTPLTSCHQHTTPAKIEALVERLRNGESIALVTDAGTPGVSDPGPALVRAAAAAGITVAPIPGPCALAAAISIAGFNAQRFSFLGFLPRKPGKLRKILAAALARDEVVGIYESPYRVAQLAAAIAELCPDRQLVVCRELTKKFEEILRGPAIEIAEILVARKKADGELRGEFVVVVDAGSEVVAEEDV